MADVSNLERAYALKSKDEATELYGNWAETYEQSFADALGYVSPRKIAEFYLSEAGARDAVLDVGAGTGLLGVHLDGAVVDALDLSPEMLEQAAAKGVYRDTIVADLTKPLPLPDGCYGGVVSSGTFTHGHVGPECLPELLRVAKSGALFCCSVVPHVFDDSGFGSALALLVAQEKIEPIRFREFNIYEGKAHEHAEDKGLAMIFRKIV